MIDDGDIREALSFIMRIYSLAHIEIQKYAPDEEKKRSMHSCLKAIGDWGYAPKKDIIGRGKEIKRILPELRRVAEYIIENNRNIMK